MTFDPSSTKSIGKCALNNLYALPDVRQVHFWLKFKKNYVTPRPVDGTVTPTILLYPRDSTEQ